MILRRLVGGLRGNQPTSPATAETAQTRFALVLMRPSVGRHLEVFREVMEVVAAGLTALGHANSTHVNEFVADARHIVFGPRLLRAEDVDRIPPTTILYNFEPLHLPVFDERKAFLTHYAPRFTVWDYSAANVRYLAERDIAARHVPLGYAKTLTRIEHAAEQDIDVLFYGDMTPRRERVIAALRAAQLNVVTLTDVYGPERDAFIGRAKVVLNVHRDDDVQALETPRIVYLLANRKAVVTEGKPGVEIESDLRSCMVVAAHEDLASASVKLVHDGARRRTLEDAGLRTMQSRDEARILAAALADS